MPNEVQCQLLIAGEGKVNPQLPPFIWKNVTVSLEHECLRCRRLNKLVHTLKLQNRLEEGRHRRKGSCHIAALSGPLDTLICLPSVLSNSNLQVFRITYTPTPHEHVCACTGTVALGLGCSLLLDYTLWDILSILQD